MKAIITTYHGPTNHKGARISARDSDGNRTTVSIRPEWRTYEAYEEAARALCSKMGWKGKLVWNDLDATKCVFVWVRDGLDHTREGLTIQS